MHTASELRASLSAELKSAACAYTNAKRAVSVLSNFVDLRAALPWEYSLVDAVISKWIDQVLSQVSTAHQGESSAVIAKVDLPSYFQQCQYFAKKAYYGMRDGDMSIVDAAELVLAHYDFKNLAQWLVKRAAELESAGFIEAATFLANELSLNADHWNASAPTVRSGRFVFERRLFSCPITGYSYNEVDKIFRLADAAGVMQRVMGVNGAHTSMQSIAVELRNARKPLPSRTVIGNGSPITATVFKEKLSLSLSPVVADALLAFVSMYATVRLVGATAQAA